MGYRLKIAEQPPEAAAFVAQDANASTDVKPIGFNTGQDMWRNFINTHVFAPPRTTALVSIEAVSGQKVEFTPGTEPHTIFQDGYWTGGSAILYRLSNGTVSKIRESAIADDANSYWRARRIFTGSSAGVPFDGFEKPAAEQWFAVRAYNAAGDVGPLSNVLNIATPAAWTGVRTSQTSAASKSLTGSETGALGAPVISATWVSGEDVLSVAIDTPASGAIEGYVLYISDDAPAALRGQFIELADDGGAAMQVGDLLVVSSAKAAPSPDLVVNRIYGAAEGRFAVNPYGVNHAFRSGENYWRTDDADNSFTWVPDGDAHFARYTITAPNGGTRITAAIYDDANSSGFYPIPANGERWIVEVDGRADAVRSMRLVIALAASYGANVVAVNGTPVTPAATYDFALTTSRATTSLEILWGTPPTSGPVAAVTLDFTEAGTFDLYGWRVYRSTAPYRALIPENKAIIEAARPHFIRDHSTVKTAGTGDAYNLRGFIENYLHSALTNTVSVGCSNFWMQLELWDVADYTRLADYLCGDGSDTWSALRVSLGRAAPWTDDLSIWFELSNETWNTINGFFNFPAVTDVADGGRVVAGSTGETYGRFSELFYQSLVTQAATHGATSAFRHVLGGRFNTDYGDIAARFAPSATLVTRAPYMRGWEVGASGVTDSPQGFRETLLWPGSVTPDRLAASEAWLAAARANGANSNLSAGTYEDAISFSSLPPSIPAVELRFAKTVAAASAYLDKIATQSAQYAIQAHFSLYFGVDWSSHDPVTKRAWPYHLWMEVWNEHCAGSKKITAKMVMPRQLGVSVAGDVYNVDEIGCHVFETGGGYVVVLINRNIPYDSIDSGDALYNAADNGSRTIRVTLPISAAASVTKYAMTGVWDAHNYDSADPKFDATIAIQPSSALANFSGGVLSISLPAAKAEMYVFEGVS